MNQLHRLQQIGVISSLVHITMIENSTSDSQIEVQTDIQQLLGDFESIFAEPTSLPPHR